MKKILNTLICLILIFVITGCEKKESDIDNTTISYDIKEVLLDRIESVYSLTLNNITEDDEYIYLNMTFVSESDSIESLRINHIYVNDYLFIVDYEVEADKDTEISKSLEISKIDLREYQIEHIDKLKISIITDDTEKDLVTIYTSNKGE